MNTIVRIHADEEENSTNVLKNPEMHVEQRSTEQAILLGPGLMRLNMIEKRRKHARHPHSPCGRQPRAISKPVRDRLRELVRNLRLARCALLISAQVLEAQNADVDADVAHILRHDIGARLDAEIDKTEALLASAERPRSKLSEVIRTE